MKVKKVIKMSRGEIESKVWKRKGAENEIVKMIVEKVTKWKTRIKGGWEKRK